MLRQLCTTSLSRLDSFGLHGSFIGLEKKGSVMRISEVFAMGGGYGQYDDSCRGGCDNFEGDPRVTRDGFDQIIGSSDDGSGLSGLVT